MVVWALEGGDSVEGFRLTNVPSSLPLPISIRCPRNRYGDGANKVLQRYETRNKQQTHSLLTHDREVVGRWR